LDILICGTAAAEGWPALFCHCQPCAEARSRGGKDIRSRSAYAVGESIRIDFGPDSNHHSFAHQLPYERLTHLLMSHSHADHFSPVEFGYRRKGFSQIPEGNLLHIYGNDRVRQKLVEAVGENLDAVYALFHPIEVWQPVQLTDGVTAIAVPAEHDRSELCVNWLLEQRGRRFLQGHDTGVWTDETFDRLAQFPMDSVALDCTYGGLPPGTGHMSCQQVVDVAERLRGSGALKPGAQVIATHFSHNGGWLHDEMIRFFAPHNIEVAHDGMRLSL